MSQIIKNLASGPVPPTVATSFVTDTNSPAVPAGNILDIFGDDTTTNNTNGLFTDGSSGSNVITIFLSNRLQGTATTADATPTTIITFPLGATPATYLLDTEIAAFSSSIPAGATYNIFGGVRTDGATATLIGTPDKIINEEAGLAAANVTMTVSGNNAIIQVTGIASSVNWRALSTYILVT